MATNSPGKSHILGALGGDDRDSSADPLEGMLDSLFTSSSSKPRRPSDATNAVSPERRRNPVAAAEPPARPQPWRSGGVGGGTAPKDAVSSERRGAGQAEIGPTSEVTRGSMTRESSEDAADGLFITSSASEMSTGSADTAGPASRSSAGARPKAANKRAIAPVAKTASMAAGGHNRGATSMQQIQQEGKAEVAEQAKKAGAGEEEEFDAEEGSAATQTLEETERLCHVRILGALHALRPSELHFLLSAWQQDRLLGDEELCTPTALRTMLRLQARRRPRRRRGVGERLGSSTAMAVPGSRGTVGTAMFQPAGRAATTDGKAHSQLLEYQRTFGRA